MKACNNCGQKFNCYYRGIIDPCDTWTANSIIRRLRTMASDIKDRKMDFEEHRFVNSCTTLLTFSRKQESWLRSIYKRVL